MSKYQPLVGYLAAQSAPVVTLTFAEIEALIGMPLSESARAAPAYWTAKKSAPVRALQRQGWRARLDVRHRCVRFARAAGDGRGPVTTKYQPLIDHLAASMEPVIWLTFDEIEEILQLKLPPTARTRGYFWSRGGGVHVREWRARGWQAHFARGRALVIFVRVAEQAQ